PPRARGDDGAEPRRRRGPARAARGEVRVRAVRPLRTAARGRRDHVARARGVSETRAASRDVGGAQESRGRRARTRRDPVVDRRRDVEAMTAPSTELLRPPAPVLEPALEEDERLAGYRPLGLRAYVAGSGATQLVIALAIFAIFVPALTARY